MEKNNKISPEDLSSIKELSNLLEKIKLQEKIYELEYKLAVSNLYVKYGLSSSDTIDPSGTIFREKSKPSSEEDAEILNSI